MSRGFVFPDIFVILQSVVLGLQIGLWLGHPGWEHLLLVLITSAFWAYAITGWRDRHERKSRRSSDLARTLSAPRINAALAIAREIYSGVGPRPDNDYELLLDVANWLDRIDNLADAAAVQMEIDHPTSRTVQEDLRRIANIVRAGSCDGIGGCCAT